MQLTILSDFGYCTLYDSIIFFFLEGFKVGLNVKANQIPWQQGKPTQVKWSVKNLFKSSGI